MQRSTRPHSEELARLRVGGSDAVAELFSTYQGRLERMVQFRLDRRLYGRIDPADVLQESYLEISRRIDEYIQQARTSFFVWARCITWQTLLMTHRLHLGVQKRNAAQEVPLFAYNADDNTAVCLAAQLAGDATSPSQCAVRDERVAQLREALLDMDAVDREVLTLRHFDHLTNNEVAGVLGLQKTAASNRYVRALERLRQNFDQPGEAND